MTKIIEGDSGHRGLGDKGANFFWTSSKEHKNGIEPKEYYAGILLPNGEPVAAAKRIVDDAWAAQQPQDSLDSRLLGLKRGGYVGAFTPREVPYRSGYVVFYPNTPHVSDEFIAAKCGGEQGLMRTVISLSANPIHSDDVLTRLKTIPVCAEALEGISGNDVVSHFLHGANGGPREFPFTIEDIGLGVRMMPVNGGQDIRRIDVSPVYDRGKEQLSAFGERKQAMLQLTKEMSVVLGQKAA